MHKAYDYDVVEADYRFNVNCLRALLRLLHSRGSQVVCYFAPERSDVPPLMDPAGEQKFNEQFEREAAELGVVVLDARHVVPNEYWGWEYDSPDRSHFTEPGHQRLAKFLADEIEPAPSLAATAAFAAHDEIQQLHLLGVPADGLHRSVAAARAFAALVAAARELLVLWIVALAISGSFVFGRHAESLRSAVDYRGPKPPRSRRLRFGGEYRVAGAVQVSRLAGRQCRI